MELIVMILAPFPIGWLVRNRMAGFIAYLALHAFVFTFQTAALLIEWAGGDTSAFGTYPQSSNASVFSYGAVNLAILLVGLALLVLGQRLGSRRRARQPAAVRLDAVTH